MARFQIPEIKGYVQGEFGKTVRLTLKDYTGAAQDISSFDGTKTVYARHEETGKEVSATASFTSAGTDGQVDFSFSDGDINRAGVWWVQVVLEDAGASKKGKTIPQKMDVETTLEG